MKYMIVRWDQQELKYVIEHYSHRWDDAEYWYNHYKKMYGSLVKILGDAVAIRNDRAREEWMVKLFGKGVKF